MKKVFWLLAFFCLSNSWSKQLDVIGSANILKVETTGTTDLNKMVRFQYCEFGTVVQCRYLGKVGNDNYFYSLENIINQKKYEQAELWASGAFDLLVALGIIAVSAGGGAYVAMAVADLELGGTSLGLTYSLATVAGGGFAGGAFETGGYGLKWLTEEFRGLNAKAQYRDVLSLSENIIRDRDFSEKDQVILDLSVALNIVLQKLNY